MVPGPYCYIETLYSIKHLAPTLCTICVPHRQAVALGAAFQSRVLLGTQIIDVAFTEQLRPYITIWTQRRQSVTQYVVRLLGTQA